MISRKYVLTLIAVSSLLGLTALSAVSAGTILGQTGTNGLSLNGQRVPSGTTLTLDAVLQTGDQPGLAHMNNGQALWLAPGTKVRFAAADLGFAVHVLAGQLAFNSEEAGIVTLAATGVLLLSAQAQVQEGAEVVTEMCALTTDETIPFCHANPGDSKCSWSSENVPNADVQARLGDGWLVLPSDVLDGQCQPKLGGGGWSKGKKAAIWLGSGAAGFVVYDQVFASDDKL